MLVDRGVLGYLRGTWERARRRLAASCLIAMLVAAGSLTFVPGPAAAAAATSSALIYAWGYNSNGQLGDGSTTNSPVPVQVELPAGVTPVAVSAGWLTSLALGSDGNVYAWGDNQYGQLGDGSTVDSPVPVRVLLPGGVTAVAVSEGFATSLALGSDGTVYAWGSNLAGQLGDGTATGPQTCGYTPCSMTPVAVSLPGGVTAAAVAEGGVYTSMALGSDGRVYAWGDNVDGQLGVGTTAGPQTCDGAACSVTPVAVSLPGGVTATAVSAGGATSLALGSDGHIYAWGDNTYGQLGDGSTADSSTPVQVSLPGGVTATAVSANGAGELALGSDGSVYAWGDNDYGQLGDGSTANSSTPVRAYLPSGTTATAVSEGSETSLAIVAGAIAALVPTATTLTVSPNPAGVGATVTLTATELAADGTNPAGSVQFQVDGTNIGSPVAVVSGAASTTAGFAAVGTEGLSAVFIPASTTYAISASALSLMVTATGAITGSEPLTISLPQSGTFTVSITPGTVLLTASGLTAAGTLQNVTVSDTRNYYPGWSASGQESDFTGSGTAAGSTISGNQLGWTPTTAGPLQGGATLGPAVAPAAPGLGTTAAVLASAAAGNGFGTNVLSANLNLLIPAVQTAGPYSGSLTITYVESAP